MMAGVTQPVVMLSSRAKSFLGESVEKEAWRRRASVDTIGKQFTSPVCTFNGTELQAWLEGNNWLKTGDVDRSDTATLWAPLEEPADALAALKDPTLLLPDHYPLTPLIFILTRV